MAPAVWGWADGQATPKRPLRANQTTRPLPFQPPCACHMAHTKGAASRKMPEEKYNGSATTALRSQACCPYLLLKVHKQLCVRCRPACTTMLGMILQSPSTYRTTGNYIGIERINDSQHAWLWTVKTAYGHAAADNAALKNGRLAWLMIDWW